MSEPTERQKIFNALRAALPERLRKRVTIRSSSLNLPNIEVRAESGSYPYNTVLTKLKIEPSYSMKKALQDNVRTRTYKRRERDNSFNYDRAADFIVQLWNDYEVVQKRRSEGKKKAETLGEQITDAIRTDPILGGLNLDVVTEPVLNTEHGETKLMFVERGDDHYSRLEFNTFGDEDGYSGELRLYGLTLEQVLALVAVINANRLNLLDQMALADDSILGPIIRRLNEKKESA